MKKNYIAPETLCLQLKIETLMTTPSMQVNNNDNNLTHDIETGGNANDGVISDSRHTYNVWDDEEDEQQY